MRLSVLLSKLPISLAKAALITNLNLFSLKSPSCLNKFTSVDKLNFKLNDTQMEFLLKRKI